MKLLFLYGPPASGKLTIARELASLTGLPLFHNHLAVDLLLSVFPFGSRPFVRLREQIWLSVFAESCRAGLPGLIFTFAPESTVPPDFPQQTVDTIAANGGQVTFIELACPRDELRRRLDSPSRRQFHKLTSAELFDQLERDGALDSSHMPQPVLTIDTSTLPPSEAAQKIVETLGFPIQSHSR